MTRHQPTHVVATFSAADEAFAMPLGVTLRSIADVAEFPVHAHVADVGMTSSSRQRIERSVDDTLVTIEWIEIDRTVLSSLPTHGHVSSATYSRLLIGELVSNATDRLLYLDADMLVRRSLLELWTTELDHSAFGAVVDAWWPRIDERSVPVHNELGLERGAPYFNSGMMLIDLDRWRELDIGRRTWDIRARYGDRLPLRDQSALNAAASGSWTSLDPVWNQQPHLFSYASHRGGPYGAREQLGAMVDPAVVHFIGSRKPWTGDMWHPFSDDWFAMLDRTAWAGWRPSVTRNGLADRVRRRALRSRTYLRARPAIRRSIYAARGAARRLR